MSGWRASATEKGLPSLTLPAIDPSMSARRGSSVWRCSTFTDSARLTPVSSSSARRSVNTMRSVTPTERDPNVILRFRLNRRDGAAGVPVLADDAAGAIGAPVLAGPNSIAMPLLRGVNHPRDLFQAGAPLEHPQHAVFEQRHKAACSGKGL